MERSNSRRNSQSRSFLSYLNPFNYMSSSASSTEQQSQQQSQQQSDLFDTSYSNSNISYDGSFESQSSFQSEDQKQEMYGVSGSIVRDRIGKENKEDLELLSSLDKNEIIVVSGSADHIENVLTAIKVPHLLIRPEQIVSCQFLPSQTVYINCHTSAYPPGTAKKLRDAVHAGTQLITTDWSLNNFITEAFPGTIAWNNQSTADELVPIECANDDDDVLKSFRDEKNWWLAGGSHPITVLDSHKVKVLIRSQELGRKNGGDAVLVRFEHGQGVVYHMISHFHLQNSATRPKHADQMSVSSYASMKGASPDTMERIENLKSMPDMNYANLQSACTNSEFVMRSAVKQKKKFF